MNTAIGCCCLNTVLLQEHDDGIKGYNLFGRVKQQEEEQSTMTFEFRLCIMQFEIQFTATPIGDFIGEFKFALLQIVLYTTDNF